MQDRGVMADAGGVLVTEPLLEVGHGPGCIPLLPSGGAADADAKELGEP